MMLRFFFLALACQAISCCVPNPPEGYKLQKAWYKHQKMVYQADVREDRIWLVMQRDVNWPETSTISVSVVEAWSGRETVIESRVPWDDLQTRIVPDGKFQGFSGAILIDGLQPGTVYRVVQTIQISDDTVQTRTTTYRTRGKEGICREMKVCKNDNGDLIPYHNGLREFEDLDIEDKMIYQADVRRDSIWLIIQRDVNWPADILFSVTVQAPNEAARVVQAPVTWGQLQAQRVADGVLKGWPSAVLVDGLSPDTRYLVTQHVQQVNGNFQWSRTTRFKTKANDGMTKDLDMSTCRNLKVCPVGDGTYFPYKEYY